MRTKTPHLATAVAALGIAAMALTGCVPTEQPSLDGENTVSEVEAEFGVGETTFHDGTLVSPHLSIEITKTEVIAPGAYGNEYGEAPVLAIWYETTNVSGQEVNPLTAWFTHFRAVQDTGAEVVNELALGLAPSEVFQKTQSSRIGDGDTVLSAVSYLLIDSDTPVELVASDALLNQLGTMILPAS